MSAAAGFRDISPTTLADILGREQVMDIGVRPLWPGIARVAGPAFTVRCGPGDNLMLHAAIYRAQPGSVLVVEAGDTDYALAGERVRDRAAPGHRGADHDGVIRDVAEVRESGFPVFARGVIPVPGAKLIVSPLGGRGAAAWTWMAETSSSSIEFVSRLLKTVHFAMIMFEM